MGAGVAGEPTAEEPVLATSLWGMLHADDDEVVLQLPERLKNMVSVIVVACAKNVIIRLSRREMLEATAIFSANHPVTCTTRYQTSYRSGGTSTTTPTCPSRSTEAYAPDYEASRSSTP